MRNERNSYNYRLINFLLAFFILFLPNTAIATSSPPLTYSTSTAESVTRAYAAEWGVSGDQMWATELCENPSLDPIRQSSYYHSGKRENSWGNSQIDLDYHPEITKKQAQDPFFSANFMAEEFSKGRQSEWYCWQRLFGQTTK